MIRFIIPLILFCTSAFADPNDVKMRDEVLRASGTLLAMDIVESAQTGKKGMIDTSADRYSNAIKKSVNEKTEQLIGQEKWVLIGTHKILARNLISQFKANGWQSHDLCLELFQNKNVVDVQKVIYRVSTGLIGDSTTALLLDSAFKEIDNAIPAFREGFDLNFKNTEENTAICKMNVAKIKPEPKTEDECPESAQSYQDKFKEKRRVNDFKCFQKALEREL